MIYVIFFVSLHKEEGDKKPLKLNQLNSKIMRKEIRKEIREYILNEVNQTLSRLGISEGVKETTVFEGRHKDRFAYNFESAPIRQMPKLFKRLVVSGYMEVLEEVKDEKNRFYRYSQGNDVVLVRLEYEYNHFGGGSNGCDLGKMFFAVSHDLPDKFMITDVHDSRYFYVDKIEGLTI